MTKSAAIVRRALRLRTGVRWSPNTAWPAFACDAKARCARSGRACDQREAPAWLQSTPGRGRRLRRSGRQAPAPASVSEEGYPSPGCVAHSAVLHPARHLVAARPADHRPDDRRGAGRPACQRRRSACCKGCRSPPATPPAVSRWAMRPTAFPAATSSSSASLPGRWPTTASGFAQSLRPSAAGAVLRRHGRRRRWPPPPSRCSATSSPSARWAGPWRLHLGSAIGAGSVDGARRADPDLAQTAIHSGSVLAHFRPWQLAFIAIGAPGLLIAFLIFLVPEPAAAPDRRRVRPATGPGCCASSAGTGASSPATSSAFSVPQPAGLFGDVTLVGGGADADLWLRAPPRRASADADLFHRQHHRPDRSPASPPTRCSRGASATRPCSISAWPPSLPAASPAPDAGGAQAVRLSGLPLPDAWSASPWPAAARTPADRHPAPIPRPDRRSTC